ncbi:MAG: hypothetical protein ABSB79_10615 [Syntrophales bacterium]
MDKGSQYKLLRAIEDKTISRVGGNEVVDISDTLFILAVQQNEYPSVNIVPDLLNRLNPYTAIKLPTLRERLWIDPDFVYEIFNKIQRELNLTSEEDKRKIENLKVQREKIWNNYVNSCKRTEGYYIKQDDEGHTIKVDIDGQIPTKISKKFYVDYQNTSAELAKLEEPFRPSMEVYTILVNYKGYDDKNVRELESILEDALINAKIANRKEILIEDLPEKVRENRLNETDEQVTDVSKVTLKDIFEYADDRKKSIVKKKIMTLVRSRNNIKETLRSEGVETESDYVGFMKKIERLLGKGYRKELS